MAEASVAPRRRRWPPRPSAAASAAYDRRTAALAERVRRLVPDFGQRPMTWGDFLAACKRGGIAFDLRKGLNRVRGDGVTLLGGARILIERDLVDPYRVFVAFHELGHAVSDHRHIEFDRPGDMRAHRRQEADANAMGLRALVPVPRLRLWRYDLHGETSLDRGFQTVTYHFSVLVGRAWKRQALSMERYREAAA